MLTKNQKCCNQIRFMSMQRSKMRLRPGLRPYPAGGVYSAFPDCPAGFKRVLTWQGGGREGVEGVGKEVKGNKGSGMGRKERGSESEREQKGNKGEKVEEKEVGTGPPIG